MKPDNASYDHERANLLLPWLVNDTLADEERVAVESHLRLCDVCREDRKLLQRMQAGISNDALTPIVPKADAGKLLGMLDERSPSRGGKSATSSKRMAAFAVAASLVALALALYRLEMPGPAPAVYDTATGGEVPGMEYVLRLRFEPAMTEQQRLAVLRSLEATNIVADGSHDYRATVSLAVGSMQQLRQYTDLLESTPGVVSADVVAVQLPVKAEQ